MLSHSLPLAPPVRSCGVDAPLASAPMLAHAAHDPFPSAAARDSHLDAAALPAHGSSSVRVADLLAMGFAWDDVHRALGQADGDVAVAQELLVEGTVAPAPSPATVSAAPLLGASTRRGGAGGPVAAAPPPPPPGTGLLIADMD